MFLFTAFYPHDISSRAPLGGIGSSLTPPELHMPFRTQAFIIQRLTMIPRIASYIYSFSILTNHLINPLIPNALSAMTNLKSLSIQCFSHPIPSLALLTAGPGAKNLNLEYLRLWTYLPLSEADLKFLETQRELKGLCVTLLNTPRVISSSLGARALDVRLPSLRFLSLRKKADGRPLLLNGRVTHLLLGASWAYKGEEVYESIISLKTLQIKPLKLVEARQFPNLIYLSVDVSFHPLIILIVPSTNNLHEGVPWTRNDRFL